MLVVGLAASAQAAGFVADEMSSPALRDVRLKGFPSEKMNDLFHARLTSDFAQRNVFGEARRAFVERDDDERGHGGLWRGEFWGKLMLGAARVSDYLQDPSFTRFVGAECRRLIALQDPDGYLGSYGDKELVSITDPEKTKSIYGWYPVWNIWNRKYAMWGMLMVYKATGDREILASVERQMGQLIDMLHRRGLRLHDTGTPAMHGLPSMSILKPLVMLYGETGNRAYLDFAAEMLPDWDRDDGECPNFYRNARLDGRRDSPCACYWKIEADGRDINLHMVETGNAWHYSYYDKTPAYAAAEVAAREAKKGLWAAEGPINPYRWRKGDRTAAVRETGRVMTKAGAFVPSPL